MSAVTTLRAKAAPPMRVDASMLLPVALAQMSANEIARLAMAAGNERCLVGDVFDVVREDASASDASDEAALVIDGDVPWLDRVGARMMQGRLVVRGSIGDQGGFQMAGGLLQIDGDAGNFTAAEMRGGRVAVHGSTGDFAAGARAGEMEGMSGGSLTIHGDAGARLADRMRRGLVLVGGDAGDFAASRLVAGTVGVAGRLGAHCAYGMRRGTLLLATKSAGAADAIDDRVPPTFAPGGRGFDVFWALLTRSLAREIAPFSQWRARPLPMRYTGDLAVDGRGEILIVG